jgi:RHS repeat-associated protein
MAQGSNGFSKPTLANQPLLYNGQELQDELNLGWLDYGARMYMPEVARWTAADPLSENNTGGTHYSYVDSNPLNLIDPDGLTLVIIGDSEYLRSALRGIINLLSSKAGANAVSNMINSKDNYVWSHGFKNSDNEYLGRVKNKEGNFNYYFNYTAKDGFVDGVRTTPATSMAHEYAHSQNDPDKLDKRQIYDAQSPLYDKDTGVLRTIGAGEIDATRFENQVRKDLGLPLRSNYTYSIMNASVGEFKMVDGGRDVYSIKYGKQDNLIRTITPAELRNDLMKQIQQKSRAEKNPFVYRASLKAQRNPYAQDKVPAGIGNKPITNFTGKDQVNRIGN